MIVFFITSPFYFVCRSAPTVYPQQPAVSGKLLSSVSILCKCWLMLRSPFDTPSIANIVKAVNTNYIPGVKKVMAISVKKDYNRVEKGHIMQESYINIGLAIAAGIISTAIIIGLVIKL